MGRIEVKVVPRSSRNQVLIEEDGARTLGQHPGPRALGSPSRSQLSEERLDPIQFRVKIWVTAAPVDGGANRAVCELLADALGLAKSKVSLVRGETSRIKVVEIDGMEADEVVNRLRPL